MTRHLSPLAVVSLLIPPPASAAGIMTIGTDGRAYEQPVKPIGDGATVSGYVYDGPARYVPSPIWQLRRTTNGNAIVTVLDDGTVVPGQGVSEAQARAVLEAMGVDPMALGKALSGEVKTAKGKKR